MSCRYSTEKQNKSKHWFHFETVLGNWFKRERKITKLTKYDLRRTTSKEKHSFVKNNKIHSYFDKSLFERRIFHGKHHWHCGWFSLSLFGSGPKCYWPQSHSSLRDFVCSPPSWITQLSKVLTWACFNGQRDHLKLPLRGCLSMHTPDFCSVRPFISRTVLELCFCSVQSQL